MNLQMEPVAPAAVEEYDVLIEQIYKNAMLVDAHILRFVCAYSDRLVKKALAAVRCLCYRLTRLVLSSQSG